MYDQNASRAACGKEIIKEKWGKEMVLPAVCG
jgi:hypothetical protein